jgi:lysyl-tRNA synthetase, class I
VTDLRTAALSSKAWPFEEARRILKRYPDGKVGQDGAAAPVLFETGYGPSGLPHIGTFNEVLRTTMVRRAYEAMIGARPEDGKTRLVAFSDDMDGLRKVPDNIPNGEMLTAHLGKPLTDVPDPFGKYDSFAAHNNAMLREFLDRFGFEYEFVSSTQQYKSGAFDDALKNVLRNNQEILDIMLPTLRAERAATYSPILPVSSKSGAVLQVPIEVLDAGTGMVRFTDASDGNSDVIEQCIFGGGAKLQWKVDWAMRWVALGVDYEMYGKDLTDSGVQSGKIAKALGGRKPEGLIYEMFLDEKGEKISKSKGNGLTLEDWLSYGSEESLAFYAYREPKAAKQLHIGVIPKAVDEYLQMRGTYPAQAWDKRLGNPVHHVHTNGVVPQTVLPVTYGLLLNLVGVMGADANKEQIWAYLGNYIPKTESGDGDAVKYPELDGLIDNAMAYTRDFVAPTLHRRKPIGAEVTALQMLDSELANLNADATAEDIQNIVYAIAKDETLGFENLRDWFKALYETLLGSSAGPRMGSFIALYGVENSRRLIKEALSLDTAP